MLRVLNGDYRLNHVFDLDSQLSCWTQNEASYAALNGFQSLAFVSSFLQLPNTQVQYWNAKAERLTLACSRSDDHIDMTLEVDQAMRLHLCRMLEAIRLETLC